MRTKDTVKGSECQDSLVARKNFGTNIQKIASKGDRVVDCPELGGLKFRDPLFIHLHGSDY